MPRPKVKLDRPGIRALLKSKEFAKAVHGIAEDIASDVRSAPEVQRNEGWSGSLSGDVEVRDYVTDRAVSSVTIAHPAGTPIEAKHGTLARAASAAGHPLVSPTRSAL